MKVVILAGGLGTRLSEETTLRPKPMVEIGGMPIIWHIMKLYSAYGIDEFIICLGYKGYLIKEYFANYYLHLADVTFDMATNTQTLHKSKVENWKVTLVDTAGLEEAAPELASLGLEIERFGPTARRFASARIPHARASRPPLAAMLRSAVPVQRASAAWCSTWARARVRRRCSRPSAGCRARRRERRPARGVRARCR